jgi:hypothetical protein
LASSDWRGGISLVKQTSHQPSSVQRRGLCLWPSISSSTGPGARNKWTVTSHSPFHLISFFAYKILSLFFFVVILKGGNFFGVENWTFSCIIPDILQLFCFSFFFWLVSCCFWR